MSSRPAHLPRTLRRLAAPLLLATLAALVTALPGAGAPAAKPAATTYVIQGVPGTSVDVLVDDESVASAVAAKEVVGPLDLAPGSHTVSFRADDWEVATSLEVGGSQDVVLHWPADAADEPVVTVFDNDVSAVGPGKGRLMVAHTAVVPPADILAGGDTLFSNIANGEFVSAEVPAATYDVSVVPTGGGTPLLGPVDLPVEAGVLTRVFAIGAPRQGSMDAVVQVISLPSTGAAPDEVDTGRAGLVGPRGSFERDRAAGLAALLGR